MPERTRLRAGDEEVDTDSFAGEMAWDIVREGGTGDLGDDQRRRRISTPRCSFFHKRSVVYTGAFKSMASARQARSPRERPTERVEATRPPATLACAVSKEKTSLQKFSATSQASLGERPRWISFP